jgi:hypothetical protein
MNPPKKKNVAHAIGSLVDVLLEVLEIANGNAPVWIS